MEAGEEEEWESTASQERQEPCTDNDKIMLHTETHTSFSVLPLRTSQKTK